MDDWRKVVLGGADLGHASDTMILQEALASRCQSHAEVDDAAMFDREVGDSLEVYFTPRAAAIMADLIAEYKGSPCDAPPDDEHTVPLYGYGDLRRLLAR